MDGDDTSMTSVLTLSLVLVVVVVGRVRMMMKHLVEPSNCILVLGSDTPLHPMMKRKKKRKRWSRGQRGGGWESDTQDKKQATETRW